MSNTIHFEKCYCSYRLGNKNTEKKSEILPLGPHKQGGKTLLHVTPMKLSEIQKKVKIKPLK